MELFFEIGKWVYVAVLAPVLGGIGGWWMAARRGRQKQKKLIAYLSGLPPEHKAVLIEFAVERTHTLGGDPYHPAVQHLVSIGFLRVGAGRGGFDAINRWIHLRSDVWEVLEPWIASEQAARNLFDASSEDRRGQILDDQRDLPQ